MCVCCVLRAEGKTRRTRDLHLAEEEEEEEEEETAPEKRLRLAKEYLAQLEEEGETERVVMEPRVRNRQQLVACELTCLCVCVVACLWRQWNDVECFLCR